MSKKIDITGKRFGKLTAVKFSYTEKNKYYWDFKCDCGGETTLRTDYVKSGRVKSCGCLNKEQLESHRNKEKLLKATKRDCYKNTKICILESKLRCTNKSGHKGIYWDKDTKKWRAALTIQGKRYQLGRYNELKDAIQARKEAEEQYFKPIIEEYKNGGQINE